MTIAQGNPGPATASCDRDNRLSTIGVVLLVILINGLVLVNGILHHPLIQYDASGHSAYVQALSQMRLPTPADSGEFFSAPLAYVIPSWLMAATGIEIFWAMKAAQLVNVALSIGLTLVMLQICDLMSSRASLKMGVLLLLGSLPAYYRTFAYVRGEPYVLFWGVVLVYLALRIFILKRYTRWNAIWLGVVMGLCALSRQWGILLFPGVFAFAGWLSIRDAEQRPVILQTLAVATAVTMVVSGWYYYSLWERYGSITTFNQDAAPTFSLSNQPPEFYTGLALRELFTNPQRPHFANQFWPILYADLWGDYWSYFVVYGIRLEEGRFISGGNIQKPLVDGQAPRGYETNYMTIGPYLGRVNRVALLPTAIFVAGIGFGLAGALLGSSLFGPHRRAIHALILLAVASSLAGYFWFLILYPSLCKGDTVKATYILQVAPLLALIAGSLFEYVSQRWRWLYYAGLVGLALVLLHNLPAMVTHYPVYRSVRD